MHCDEIILVFTAECVSITTVFACTVVMHCEVIIYCTVFVYFSTHISKGSNGLPSKQASPAFCGNNLLYTIEWAGVCSGVDKCGGGGGSCRQ